MIQYPRYKRHRFSSFQVIITINNSIQYNILTAQQLSDDG